MKDVRRGGRGGAIINSKVPKRAVISGGVYSRRVSNFLEKGAII